VLFNANDDSQNYQVDELVGLDYILHPVLQVSTDLVVRTASFDKTSGIFSVPARTTAVYVLTRSAAEQLALLKMDVQKLVAENVLNAGQGKSLISKIDIALSRLAQGKEQKAVSTLQAFISQVNSLELEGILTFEQAEALRKAALDTITTIQND
ncbi:MAG: DUF3372 domain-containing protein, partial [Chloroflexi bacterium]